MLCVVLAGVLATSARAAEGLWTENATEALARAARENKDVLIHFTGSDWCGWCFRLHDEVFHKEPFVTEAPKRFVFLELDFPRRRQLPEAIRRQNREWQMKLGVRGFPTIFLVDATGRPYAKTGYRRGGAEAYMKHLDELRKIRLKRDAAMAKARSAQGVEKAKLLDQALAAIDPALVMGSYADVVDQIVQLDPNNRAGLRDKYGAMALMGKVEQAVQRGQFDEALRLVDGALRKAGDRGQLAQDLHFMKGVILFRQGQRAGAQAALQAALRAAPQGNKAARLRMILARVFNAQP